MKDQQTLTIKTSGLTKRYGQAVVVNGLDLHVKAGQCYGLLGPNGAGKSTTIHMLTTMTSPTAGEAWIVNQSILADPVAIRRSVGLVFQDSALDRTMTVDENLQFAAALYGMSKKQANERIEELLAVFNLGSRRNTKLLALSGGQRRAVDIARGVLHQPQVLFLDEPTIGLDPIQIIEIRKLIQELAASHTIILSSHILPEITQICQRVIIINEGEIAAVDSLEGLTASLRKSERLSLTVRNGNNAIEEKLAALEQVLSVLPGEKNQFLLECELNSNLQDEIARLALENQWGLVEIKPLSLTLEDIFLKLTIEEKDVKA